MDFDAIADKVEGLQRDLAYANHLCEQANLQFDKYRIDVHELKQSRETQRAFNEVLQHALARERVKSAALEAQLQTCLQEVRRHKVVAAQWQARLNTETASLNAMTKHAHALEQRMTDLQLDVEYLKCTTTTAPTTTGDDPELERAPTAPPDCDAPLPAQPFVVVLVDGDFYQVSVI
jgi:DNA repair exonuclease SbcCD ATPase subunit